MKIKSYLIPKDIKWSKEDFFDLYKTMWAFHRRFMKRHKKLGEVKK